ncbi:hypothetical protein [Polyangium mundeleinium]|uniref:Secreted protein n=1 Tax=Polyangium mundeleinium TaxID=2995306 RepID=A0ABT5EN28_9BACT|nr:hypothetical protein [Polyangium mundeleinium]MDC0742150.1 hypothetical protein [Polyangium mundeleinium]
MNIKWTAAALLIAGLFTSAAADAACTSNPFRMGWDAAKQACEDIAQGYTPMPWGYRRSASGDFIPIPEPERTCSWQDVVECKNAAAQYLRRFQNHGCARLIRRNERLTSSRGTPIGTAQGVWRTYVNTTCNMP